MSELTKHQQQGISLRTFAEQTGIREGQLLYYAKKGQIIGARKHPLTKKWWIYPPAKLVLSDGGAYTPRSKPRNSSAAGGLPPCAAVGVGVAVDVGTSPHGLSAVLPPSVQETREAAALPEHFSGRPPLTSDALRLSAQNPPLSDEPAQCQIFEPEDSDELPDWVPPGELPDVFAEPGLQETMRRLKKAAGETHYPLVLSGSQMELVSRAISLAIEDVIEAMNEELDATAARLEIQPDLDAYNQIHLLLRAAKAARKNANEDWRGMEL